MSDGPDNLSDSQGPDLHGSLPDYAFLSRWFRGPPAATTGFDSFLAYFGAVIFTCAAIAVTVRSIWF